jgi:hypothetical protein
MVGIGPPPPPPASESVSPLNPKEGGERGGGPNSDNWIENLAICVQYSVQPPPLKKMGSTKTTCPYSIIFGWNDPFTVQRNTALRKQTPQRRHYVFDTQHKVQIYLEFNSVCPLSRKRVCSPPEPKGKGHTRLQVRGWGDPIQTTREKA